MGKLSDIPIHFDRYIPIDRLSSSIALNSLPSPLSSLSLFLREKKKKKKKKQKKKKKSRKKENLSEVSIPSEGKGGNKRFLSRAYTAL